MEHILQEHKRMSESTGFHCDEVVLHCSACGSWISMLEDQFEIEEFKEEPCNGSRQFDEEE